MQRSKDLEIEYVVPQNSWVFQLCIRWFSPNRDLKEVNNTILALGTEWVEARGLSLAGGPSRRLPERQRVDLKLIVEDPNLVDESMVLPEDVAEEFLTALRRQAMERGWRLTGGYRRFTEEEGLPIPYR